MHRFDGEYLALYYPATRQIQPTRPYLGIRVDAGHRCSPQGLFRCPPPRQREGNLILHLPYTTAVKLKLL